MNRYSHIRLNSFLIRVNSRDTFLNYIMPKNLLEDLNLQQQQAVLATDGPILILAGAGSGKTRVLIYRVAYLIKEKMILPENILMVTFTNKAANEMRERINKLLGKTQLGFIGTFHSLCAKILRIDGQEINIPKNYLIYDEADQLEAIKEVMKKLDIPTKKFYPSSVLNTISGAKNELISSLEYPQYARGYFQKTVAQIYLAYQKSLKENQALDFDDLLMETVRLFRKQPEVLGKYQNKFQYILVDEYQDTNHAQYVLTKLLASRYKNICVVGDAAQSIYMWRGADFRNVLEFKNTFPETKIFNLEQNYRSTQKILDTAFSVISKNHSHPILKLWTKNESGERIYLYEARNEHDEAEFIVKIINKLARERALTLSSFAVLYRTNAQSRVVEEVFLHEGTPYILVGGTRFYERKEIKDVLALLKLLVNEKDTVSYKRIEKLGKTRLNKFLEWKDSLSLDLSRAQSRDSFLIRLNSCEIINMVLKATDYWELYNPEVEEDLYRLENIKELRSVAQEFPELVNFLENVALVEQEYLPDHPIKNGQRKNAVTLMTMHAAKGLEFPIIFIVGMEEGLFPHSRSLFDNLELEEERRLCYVALTRAMKKIYLTYTSSRLYFGNRSQNPVSRFINDIPPELLELVS